MAILSSRETKLLVTAGFVACNKGKILEARQIFSALLEDQENLALAKQGLAFSNLVVDDFENADKLLTELIEADEKNYDAASLLVLSKVLQKKREEADKYINMVPTTEGAYNLIKAALELEV